MIPKGLEVIGKSEWYQVAFLAFNGEKYNSREGYNEGKLIWVINA
ncbi:MAG: hypothetical protein NXI00_05905 [Cytophagales bacterium]|nr:hypothetical protein [Cytophagales bacterium]